MSRMIGMSKTNGLSKTKLTSKNNNKGYKPRDYNKNKRSKHTPLIVGSLIAASLVAAGLYHLANKTEPEPVKLPRSKPAPAVINNPTPAIINNLTPAPVVINQPIETIQPLPGVEHTHVSKVSAMHKLAVEVDPARSKKTYDISNISIDLGFLDSLFHMISQNKTIVRLLDPKLVASPFGTIFTPKIIENRNFINDILEGVINTNNINSPNNVRNLYGIVDSAKNVFGRTDKKEFADEYRVTYMFKSLVKQAGISDLFAFLLNFKCCGIDECTQCGGTINNPQVIVPEDIIYHSHSDNINILSRICKCHRIFNYSDTNIKLVFPELLLVHGTKSVPMNNTFIVNIRGITATYNLSSSVVCWTNTENNEKYFGLSVPDKKGNFTLVKTSKKIYKTDELANLIYVCGLYEIQKSLFIRGVNWFNDWLG